MNRLNNTTIFVNECTPKLEKIKLWLKTWVPFVAFYTSFGWKTNHKIHFWFSDFDSCFKRMNFGRIYTYDSVWNDGKRNILTPWKHQCETSLIFFHSDSTKSICFEEKSNLCNTWRFLRSYFIFKIKAKFSVIRKPCNSLFCSDLW